MNKPTITHPFRNPRHLLLAAVMTLGLLSISSPVLAADPLNVDWVSLNLNSDQSTQINQLEGEWKRLCGQLLPQVERDKADLMRELSSPNPDQGKIQELQRRIQANKSKLQEAAMTTFLKKKQQLTPDQRSRLQMKFH
ncbi:MAG: Spy/CpxP family protein refolding chaperone [Candidatus Melainabacteria bacterium]